MVRLLASVLLCIVAAQAACTKDKPSGAPLFGGDAGPAAAVPVEVVVLQTGLLENTLRFSTNLEAEVEVQALARAPGQVVRLMVEEGDQVKQGQLLVKLEDAEQRSTLRRTQAELAHAARTSKRQEALLSHGVVSDDARENAAFELSRLKIANAEAKRLLSYTSIRAAVDGTVTLRQVKRGDFVNPNQHLFTVTDFKSLVAKVYVPENDMASVKKGQVVRLVSPSDPALARDAVVERVAPIVDPRSGTAKVTIAIPDTSNLRPGAFLSVELVTSRAADAVLLPRKALVYDNERSFAFKVEDGLAARVPVRPTLSGPDFVQAPGFAAGDSVVVAGQVGLKAGAKVSPKILDSNSRKAEQAPSEMPIPDAPAAAK
ncbi:MAG: efflux RND transporter periplasmic adaptor subunit [Myxococcales bacterium]|nr:efflux RND transporter periplasmic adaptor subunit [Myxococcales bacterium]